jgi:hypothetical protein
MQATDGLQRTISSTRSRAQAIMRASFAANNSALSSESEQVFLFLQMLLRRASSRGCDKNNRKLDCVFAPGRICRLHARHEQENCPGGEVSQEHRLGACRPNTESRMPMSALPLACRMTAGTWIVLIRSHSSLHDVSKAEPLRQLWVAYSSRWTATVGLDREGPYVVERVIRRVFCAQVRNSGEGEVN